MSGVRWFGERAEREARRYAPSALPLLVIAPDGAVDALREAVALRQAGRLFETAFVLEEPQTIHARIFGPHVLGGSQDFDQRRNLFELLDRGQLELNKQPQAALGRLTEPVQKTLCDVAALGEGIVAQSWHEHRRTCALLGIRKPVRRVCVADADIPQMLPDPGADAIVVWAPEEQPAAIGPLLFALEELRRPAYAIARPGQTYGLKTAIVDVSEAASVLKRARVVIDAEVNGPAVALALMNRGFTVVAAASSGVTEYVPDVPTYRPWSRRSVFAAVSAALGSAPRSVAVIPAVSGEAPAPRAVTQGVHDAAPLVSLIVRTLNRPRLLRRALQSASVQTYPNVEIVVINDGGDHAETAHICGDFPRVTLTTIAKSGVAGAATAGVRAASGTYANFLDDDDALFPDHVERLAVALQRSACLAAYADGMNVYLRSIRDDYAVTGYRGILIPALEPSTMLWTCQIVGIGRMMFDRAWVAREGLKAECAPADDYEAWLRIVAASDVARVPAVTHLYSQFQDKTNTSVASGGSYAAAHRVIYALHPTERPAIVERRAAIVRELDHLGGLGMAPAVVTLDPQPLLFGGRRG